MNTFNIARKLLSYAPNNIASLISQIHKCLTITYKSQQKKIKSDIECAIVRITIKRMMKL